MMLALRASALLLLTSSLCFGVGCIDPERHDRALAEIDAMRREAATREATLHAMEERQNAMGQQMAMVMTLATQNLSRDPHREDERDRKLTQLNDKMDRIEALVSRMREEDAPTPIDLAAARRAAEQGSEEERASAVRKVQTLLDAGQVKVIVRNGRMQLSLVRPIDAHDPYREKQKPKAVDADKEKLRDLLDSR